MHLMEFVDGDDWIASTTYFTALYQMQTYQVDLVKWSTSRVYNKKVVPVISPYQVGVYRGQNLQKLLQEIIRNQGIDNSISNCLFSKRIVDNFHIRTPVGMNQGEDLYFFTAYCARINAMFLDVNSYFYNYRQYPTSLTKQYSPKYVREISLLLEEFPALLNSLPEGDLYIPSFCYRVNKLVFYLLLISADFDWDNLQEKIYMLRQFYTQFKYQLTAARRYNTISWSKRIPVILFYKRYFRTALFVAYCSKIVFQIKHKVVSGAKSYK